MRKPQLLTSALSSLLFATWTIGAVAAEPKPAQRTSAQTQSDPTTTTTTTTTSPITSDPMVSVGTEERSLPNVPLLVTGTMVLGASYGGSALWAGLSDREWDDKLYYPVAGPWLALDDRDCNAEPCENKTLDTTLLISSGIVQGLGALGMVMSLVVPETNTRNWYLIGNQDFMVAPVAGPSTVGATAVGTF